MSGLVNSGVLLLLAVHFFPTSAELRKPPILTSNAVENIINEGELLRLTCAADGDIKFYYPNSGEENGVLFSSPPSDQKDTVYENNTISEGTKKNRFTLEKIVLTTDDTGFYGCAYHDVKVQKNFYNQPEVTWIYIYVTSNIHSFVWSPQSEVIGYFGHTSVIPCRPTSPNYHVTLHVLKENRYQEIKRSERVKFDPKYGFEIHNTTLDDSTYYKCEIMKSERNPYIVIMMVFLEVVYPPALAITSSPYAIEDGDVSLRCSTVWDDIYNDLQLQWVTPKGDIYYNNMSEDDRITSEIFISDNYYPEKINHLTIRNVDLDDEGNYTCKVQSNVGSVAQENRYIPVFNPAMMTINLRPRPSTRLISARIRQNVTFFVTIEINSKIENKEISVEWSGPVDKNISNSDIYEITNTANSTQLVIKQVQPIHSGQYVLSVTNAHQTVTRNFILEILCSPVVEMYKKALQSFYKPKTDVQIQCHSTGLPRPNITWSFEKYFDNGTYGSSKLLVNVSPEEGNETDVTSTVSMKLLSTGKIICEACNKHKCVIQEEIIVVADDELKILTRRNDALKNVTITFTCVASNYYYTNITWISQNHEDMKETDDRLQIFSQKTLYTHESNLQIGIIKKCEKQTYSCAATAINGTRVLKEENLAIALEAPRIDNSNMNGSESTYDLQTGVETTLILTCYVSGCPYPNISWYQDDQALTEDNDGVYKFSNGTQLLTIHHPDSKHSGRYRCKAQNHLGFAEASQKIVIQANKRIAIGIILGSIVPLIVGLIVAISYVIIRWKKRAVLHDAVLDIENFEEGNLTNLTSELSAKDRALCLPYNKKWEFPREKLKFQKQLGCGQFGMVVKAKAYGILENENSTIVAVKMVKKAKDLMHVKALASELKILTHLGRHLNIVNLLGACTSDLSKGQLLVIVEYCHYGNLQTYLFKSRRNFINQIDPSTGKINLSIGGDVSNKRNGNHSSNLQQLPNTNSDITGQLDAVQQVISSSNYHRDTPTILTTNLLAWAFQVARGMQYLSQRKILHGDLAARNVLLAHNNLVKICDFGLARNLYHYELYKKKSRAPLPLRWMAVESIRDRIFSIQSDVWSFGIFLWEIFTLASTPYPEFKTQEVYKKLIEGYRMGKSEFMTDEIYNVMFRCWDVNPALRPTFSKLEETIGSMLPKSVETHFVNLNSPYVHYNATENDGTRDYLSLMSHLDHEIPTSRTTNPNGHCSTDLVDTERETPDDSIACSLDQLPDTTVSFDTAPAESANSPNSSQPENVPQSHPTASRSVTLMTSMLIGRIMGFRNPSYISADSIVRHARSHIALSRMLFTTVLRARRNKDNGILQSFKPFAKEHSITLEKISKEMRVRDRKVIAKTINTIGIVAPYDTKTQLGYRNPCITDSQLLKIVRILKANDSDENRADHLETIEEVVRYATIAADECDFGTPLKVGQDLFSSGVDCLAKHTSVMLNLAYHLLKRPQFAAIAAAHMKDRKKGCDLSVL